MGPNLKVSGDSSAQKKSLEISAKHELFVDFFLEEIHQK